MRTLFRLIGLVIALAIVAGGVFVYDLVWNDSRLFYWAAGRDKLESACRPLTMESLIGKGFSPVDLVFGPQPSLGFASGPDGTVKTLSGPISFSDGPNGTVIRGAVTCEVRGHTVKVDVSVDQLPRRAA